MAARLPHRPRRLAFLGTPEPAARVLREVVGAGWPVEVVVTGPDRRRRRRGPPSPSPVKAAATELGLRVAHRVDAVPDAAVDLGVVVAYGRLIRPHVLDAVPMVNVHFSLLPRWRGAAPVERAVLAGDERTGVCLMQLDEGLDTGPVLDCEEVAIGPDEHADALTGRLTDLGAALLVRHLAAGLPEPRPQRGEATYAAKIEPEELRIDWSRPAVEIHRLVRLGRAWTTFRGERLRVLSARVEPGAGPARPGELDGVAVGTGDGTLVLGRVQPAGRRPLDADAWARGARPERGEALGA